MTLRLVRLAVVAVATAIGAAPAANAGVLKTNVGAVTNLAADGTNVAYVTYSYSKSCPPVESNGTRRQVAYLNVRTGKSVLLTTGRDCAILDGPGFGISYTDHWFGISQRHVFWINTNPGGDHFYFDTLVATPGSKPIGTGYGGDSGDGLPDTSLVAWGGRSYQIERIVPPACGMPPQPQPGTCPVQTVLRSFDAAGGEQITPLAVATGRFTAPLSELQAVSASGALLLDPSGSLSIATPSTTTLLVDSAVEAAAMSAIRIVGISHAGSAVHLSSWNPIGARTGSCTARVGANTPNVTIAGRLVAFATSRGIYAATIPTGSKTSCRAARLVSVPEGVYVAGLELTTSGGLIYATNAGRTTVRSVVARLSPKQLAAVGLHL